MKKIVLVVTALLAVSACSHGSSQITAQHAAESYLKSLPTTTTTLYTPPCSDCLPSEVAFIQDAASIERLGMLGDGPPQVLSWLRQYRDTVCYGSPQPDAKADVYGPIPIGARARWDAGPMHTAAQNSC